MPLYLTHADSTFPTCVPIFFARLLPRLAPGGSMPILPASDRSATYPVERRRFMAAIAGGLLAAPLAAEAQQPGKVYRIGWLATGPILDNLEAFRSGLRALGYLDGHNVVIEPRYAVGQNKPLAV